MSKKRLNITFCIILLFVFLITASAHSGRTDANGGHWNRSTGEYHYHTGEYAGRSQSSSKSSSSSNNSKATLEAIERLKREHAQKAKREEEKKVNSQKKDKPTFCEVVIGIFQGFIECLGWLALLYVPYWIYVLIKKIFNKK